MSKWHLHDKDYHFTTEVCTPNERVVIFSVTQSGSFNLTQLHYMQFQLSISLIPSSHSHTLRISGRQSHMTTPAI